MPSTTTQVALSSFGNESPSFQTLEVATIQIQTLTGDLVPVSVLIVPKIATPIQNSCRVDLDSIPHLKGLKLANPVTDRPLTIMLKLLLYTWVTCQRERSCCTVCEAHSANKHSRGVWRHAPTGNV